jgi:predicted CoA-binding protein
MTSIADAATEFLSHDRIAVAGVSRNATGHGGNVVYTRLRDRGYTVFPVNPNAETVEGDRCYPDLASIPGGVDGVVIATRPAAAASVVEECAKLGISRVWMHRSFGGGSVSEDAVTLARKNGMTVIPGGCPLMFGKTSDGGHRFMCWFGKLTGSVPRTV